MDTDHTLLKNTFNCKIKHTETFNRFTILFREILKEFSGIENFQETISGEEARLYSYNINAEEFQFLVVMVGPYVKVYFSQKIEGNWVHKKSFYCKMQKYLTNPEESLSLNSNQGNIYLS